MVVKEYNYLGLAAPAARGVDVSWSPNTSLMVLAATRELSLLMSSGSTSVATAGSSGPSSRTPWRDPRCGSPSTKLSSLVTLSGGAVVVRNPGAEPDTAGAAQGGAGAPSRRLVQPAGHPRRVIPAQRVDALHRLVEQKLAKMEPWGESTNWSASRV